MIGNVDSGKSTLVGVLTKGIFDDGRGSAREVLIRNPYSVYSTINTKNKTAEHLQWLRRSWDSISNALPIILKGSRVDGARSFQSK